MAETSTKIHSVKQHTTKTVFDKVN